MNALNNSVTLIGFLGRDVEITELSNGIKIGKTSIATNSFYVDRKGEKVQKTEWHPVIAWNKTAEKMGKSLKKGSHVMLQGQLNYESYKTKDGEMKYTTQVRIMKFQSISKKEATESI